MEWKCWEYVLFVAVLKSSAMVSGGDGKLHGLRWMVAFDVTYLSPSVTGAESTMLTKFDPKSMVLYCTWV